MIKKVNVLQLMPGMYVHDLNCNWFSHPFLRRRFLIKNKKRILRIFLAGIREVYIDTQRGQDIAAGTIEFSHKQAV